MLNVSRWLLLLAVVLSSQAFAQLVPKPDGEWRGLIGLNITSVTGNARSTSLGLTADGVRQTERDKTTLWGQVLRSSATVNGQSGTTADLWRLGGRYDWNLNDRMYAFGIGGLERDKLAKLNLRLLAGGGVGYKVLTGPDVMFDVFGGLNLRHDRYADPGVTIDNSLRSSYTAPELLLGEESTHKLTETTSFRQRFVLYPNMRDFGEYRWVFDAGIVVSMSDRLKLTGSLINRYDSLATTPVKTMDTILFAGVAYAIGPLDKK